jgi:hypothetical protein
MKDEPTEEDDDMGDDDDMGGPSPTAPAHSVQPPGPSVDHGLTTGSIDLTHDSDDDNGDGDANTAWWARLGADAEATSPRRTKTRSKKRRSREP